MTKLKVTLQRDGFVKVGQMRVGKWVKTNGFNAQYVFTHQNGKSVSHYSLKKFKEEIHDLCTIN